MFEVDPHFPKTPDGLVLGGVGGNAADSQGNVWVFHRPHTLEEGNAHENGYKPAPPVVMFDEKGNYVDSSRNMRRARRARPRGGPTAMVVREAANTESSSITATTSG